MPLDTLVYGNRLSLLSSYQRDADKRDVSKQTGHLRGDDMNRSALMISIFVGFGVLGFVGCGDTENSKSERSGSSQAESDNIELSVGTDKIEFSVQPPSDSDEGLALRSLMPDAKPPVKVQPEPVEPPTEVDSRITIKCKNEEILALAWF